MAITRNTIENALAVRERAVGLLKNTELGADADMLAFYQRALTTSEPIFWGDDALRRRLEHGASHLEHAPSSRKAGTVLVDAGIMGEDRNVLRMPVDSAGTLDRAYTSFYADRAQPVPDRLLKDLGPGWVVIGRAVIPEPEDVADGFKKLKTPGKSLISETVRNHKMQLRLPLESAVHQIGVVWFAVRQFNGWESIKVDQVKVVGVRLICVSTDGYFYDGDHADIFDYFLDRQFLQSKFVVSEPRKAKGTKMPKHRLPRTANPNFHVVVLRKIEKDTPPSESSPSTPSGHHWTLNYEVTIEPFYRNQYYPSTKTHKRIRIEAHTKGPKGVQRPRIIKATR